VSGQGDATETPIGAVPTPTALNTEGLGLSAKDLEALLRVDDDAWRDELPAIEDHFATFGDRIPAVLREELEELRRRLG
jgi:phosphoenolpyruvate carboxykinase (GTP)